MDSNKSPHVHHKTEKGCCRLRFRSHHKTAISVIFIVIFLYGVFILYNIEEVSDCYSRIWSPKQISSTTVVKLLELPNNSFIDIKTFIENGIAQNDPRVVDYIKKNHLFPPSTLPYNLSDIKGEPGVGIYNGQNVFVKEVLKNKTNGFFVDAGAHDGEYLSNTLTLERDFNWTGLLVEPSPIELPNLRSKNRKSWIADVCLSPTTQPSKLEYLHRPGYTIASKLKDKETESELKATWKVYRLQCFPLFSLLSALGVKEIDYFSLDVEGVELKVLNSIPFDSVFIKVISVEFNLIPEGKASLIAFMQSKGYISAKEVYHDCIFVHKSVYSVNVTAG